MADPIARKQLTEVMKLAAEVQVESIVEFSSRDEEVVVWTSIVEEAQNYGLGRLGDDNKNVFNMDIARNTLKASSGDIEGATEMDNCAVSMKLSPLVVLCDHVVSLVEGVDDWGTFKKTLNLSSRQIKNQFIPDMENKEAVRIGADVWSPCEDFRECGLNSWDAKVVRDLIYGYHTHDVLAKHFSWMVAQWMNTPVEFVWPVVSRFDKPQSYNRFVCSCNIVCGDGDANLQQGFLVKLPLHGSGLRREVGLLSRSSTSNGWWWSDQKDLAQMVDSKAQVAKFLHGKTCQIPALQAQVVELQDKLQLVDLQLQEHISSGLKLVEEREATLKAEIEDLGAKLSSIRMDGQMNRRESEDGILVEVEELNEEHKGMVTAWRPYLEVVVMRMLPVFMAPLLDFVLPPDVV
ncbi:hypothetical protein SUGI_0352210 [Cryptomeria japonica]|nr:hypothetical protein SUGI_0352210 [Cryptomeria japonica]